uniref:Integrin, alpha V n=1 Tax=Cyprinus carpio carpio TaxID=630221 RepID=A0A9J8AKK9_CYPCA
MEFKSNQWFGATVRSTGDHILACAPLYQWSTYGLSEREPVGTCFLKKGNSIVEYSPCRSSTYMITKNRVVIGGPGSFYWQGQLISDDITEVISRYNKEFFTPYSNQLTTKSAGAQYDDSYLGNIVVSNSFLILPASLDYVTGVPRGEKALGYVNIFNGRNMESMYNFTGTQVSVTKMFTPLIILLDFVKMDLLVGAPLFMDRGSDGKLREVGQVYVYLGKGGFTFNNVIKLTGSEIYARYGSSICSLGDLNMDGYNDVAIAAPYGGQFHRGLVYIHNGRPTGPNPVASQVLEGTWASASMPSSFGYAMNGGTDTDDTCLFCVSRARPVISVNTTLDISPQILNPEDKSCTLPGTTTKVSCFTVKYCLKANGKGAPSSLHFQVDLTLDRLKHKGAIKRVQFLHNKMPNYSKNMTVSNSQGQACEELQAFLIDDSEFRDKITPISVFMEYSLDYKTAADKTGLLPILDQSTPTNVTKQAHILLDCGEDNICKPDLKLSVVSDQKQIYIGDDNPLTLEVTAENGGEGAYEADLTVTLPSQADFIGVVRNSEKLSRLSCAFKRENQTRVVVCDLGNPMKGGTKILAGLRFSVLQLSEQDTEVKFDLQIKSSICSILCRVSAPEQVFLPIANWQPKQSPVLEDDIGPLVQHIYELRNTGPSTFSKAILDVQWPYRFNNGSLLYITKFDVDGNMNCSSNRELNPLNVTVCIPQLNHERMNRRSVHRRDLEDKQEEENLEILDCGNAECQEIKCWIGRLEKGQSAILFIYSRLAVSTFLKAESQNKSYNVRSTASFSVIEMPYKNLHSELPTSKTSVIWNSENPQPVPGWVVALAVLAGLLLLALLIFVMYKLGFFKRVRPPQDDNIEKEQLQPQENGDRNTEA